MGHKRHLSLIADGEAIPKSNKEWHATVTLICSSPVIVTENASTKFGFANFWLRYSMVQNQRLFMIKKIWHFKEAFYVVLFLINKKNI